MFATTIFRRSATVAAAATLLVTGIGISTAPTALAQDNTTPPAGIGFNYEYGKRIEVKFVETPDADLDEQMQIIKNVARIFGSEATHLQTTTTGSYLVELDPKIPFDAVETFLWLLERKPEIEFAENSVMVPSPHWWMYQ